MEAKTFAGAPLPWRASPNNTNACATIHDAEGICIGTADSRHAGMDAPAIAVLFAAAPELEAQRDALAKEIRDFNELIVAPLKAQRDALADALVATLPQIQDFAWRMTPHQIGGDPQARDWRKHPLYVQVEAALRRAGRLHDAKGASHA